MKTKHLEIFTTEQQENIKTAAEILRDGGLVVIPTETVYGLAANAFSGEAVKNIFSAKGRPQDNPLIVHISNKKMLKDIVSSVPENAERLFKEYWPGPLTVIMPKSPKIPDEVSGGLETVAVRMPSNKVALAIIEESGVPLAAPSANLSGSPSPTTAKHVLEDMDGRVDAIVISSDSKIGVESTVITLCTTPPRLLRPGAVTFEQLRVFLPDIVIDQAVLTEPESDQKVASPGMKYKHYSPKTEVFMIEADADEFAEFVNKNDESGTFALCFEEEKEKIKIPYICYGFEGDDLSKAHELFNSLRLLDEKGAKKAFAHAPRREGVGLGVYNRLIRAAGFKVIKL